MGIFCVRVERYYLSTSPDTDRDLGEQARRGWEIVGVSEGRSHVVDTATDRSLPMHSCVSFVVMYGSGEGDFK